ncbi:hypothetical protein BT96DRAFT_1003008 [Gymnopus androsaceus JB14]|uniref:Uncharacterized protein n=1 Tax=Gymnopus androsaceus JB14 TaxID=1447944 RepID=A0A6A4GX27_9AGAR|nr:hypothetical protein BT96DRAFT_1003008 [Gymnopus androsaceus JB14]
MLLQFPGQCTTPRPLLTFPPPYQGLPMSLPTSVLLPTSDHTYHYLLGAYNISNLRCHPQSPNARLEDYVLLASGSMTSGQYGILDPHYQVSFSSYLLLGLLKTTTTKRSTQIPKLIGYGNDHHSSQGLQALRDQRRLTRAIECVLPSVEGWIVQLSTRASSEDVEKLPWTVHATRSTSYILSSSPPTTTASLPLDQVVLCLAHAPLIDDHSLLKWVALEWSSAIRELKGQRDPSSYVASAESILPDVGSATDISVPSSSSIHRSAAISIASLSSTPPLIRITAERSTGAEKTILSRVKRNYIYFSSYFQEPEAKWKRTTEARGVTITRLNSIDPTLVVYRAEATFVGVGLWDMYGAVVFPGAKNYRDKQHDAVLLEDWTRLCRTQDNLQIPATIQVFPFSADDPHLFPRITPLDPNINKTQVDLQDWAIEALSPNATLPTLLEQSNPKGWSNKTSTPNTNTNDQRVGWYRRRIITAASSWLGSRERAIEGISAQELATVIMQRECRKNWDDRFDSERMFKSYGSECKTSFVVSKGGFPFRDRRFYIAFVVAQAQDSSPSVSRRSTEVGGASGTGVGDTSNRTALPVSSRQSTARMDRPLDRRITLFWCTRLVAVDYAGSLSTAVNSLLSTPRSRTPFSLSSPGFVLADRKDEDMEAETYAKLGWNLRRRDDCRMLLKTRHDVSSRGEYDVGDQQQITPHAIRAGLNTLTESSLSSNSSLDTLHGVSSSSYSSSLIAPTFPVSPTMPAVAASIVNAPPQDQLRQNTDLLLGEIVMDSKLYPKGYMVVLESKTRTTEVAGRERGSSESPSRSRPRNKPKPINLDPLFPSLSSSDENPREMFISENEFELPILYTLNTMPSSPLDSSGMNTDTSETPTRHLLRLMLPMAQFQISTVQDPLAGEGSAIRRQGVENGFIVQPNELDALLDDLRTLVGIADNLLDPDATRDAEMSMGDGEANDPEDGTKLLMGLHDRQFWNRGSRDNWTGHISMIIVLLSAATALPQVPTTTAPASTSVVQEPEPQPQPHVLPLPESRPPASQTPTTVIKRASRRMSGTGIPEAQAHAGERVGAEAEVCTTEVAKEGDGVKVNAGAGAGTIEMDTKVESLKPENEMRIHVTTLRGFRGVAV